MVVAPMEMVTVTGTVNKVALRPNSATINLTISLFVLAGKPVLL